MKRSNKPDGRSIDDRQSSIVNSEDSLHGQITAHIKGIVGELFEEARQNPNSDANQMVRLMLLNQVANLQADSGQDHPASVLAEERRRGIEHDRQVELDRYKLSLMGKREELMVEQIRQIKQKLDSVKKEAKKAEDALAQGQPLDPRAVYRRISEIVGLRAPSGAEAP